jgi:pantetheine-phosphate adenylyltransferase
MRRAIYPGSFDPVTNGHLDIIERGCKLFDEIIIAILVNPEKQPFFTIEERQEMLTDVLKDISQGGCNVRVDSFRGLLVNYAVAQEADAIVRGIRAISDYEYELQLALMNSRLFHLGGEIGGLVPPSIEKRMKEKMNNP